MGEIKSGQFPEDHFPEFNFQVRFLGLGQIHFRLPFPEGLPEVEREWSGGSISESRSPEQPFLEDEQ